MEETLRKIAALCEKICPCDTINCWTSLKGDALERVQILSCVLSCIAFGKVNHKGKDKNEEYVIDWAERAWQAHQYNLCDDGWLPGDFPWNESACPFCALIEANNERK